MTEKEWLECRAPWGMTDFLREKVGDRKLRLFACACCRNMWHLLANSYCQNAVEVAERFADAQASLAELEEAATDVRTTMRSLGILEAGRRRASFEAAEMCASTTGRWFGDTAHWTQVLSTFRDDAKAAQISFLHDIVGPLPFRPAILDVGSSSNTIVGLAQAIYDARAFDRLPILADALEESGCTDAGILAHCRSDGPHVRGCWVVDLILGKK